MMESRFNAMTKMASRVHRTQKQQRDTSAKIAAHWHILKYPKNKPMKTKTPRRESHAKMMLGLAMTRLARLNAGTAQFHEITIAAKEIERWKQALADESVPLVRK